MLHFVIKAKKIVRPPWKKTRTAARLLTLSQQMAGAFRGDLIRGFQKFRSRVDPQKVYDAWLSKDWTAILETLPWNQLPEDLSALQDLGFNAALEGSSFGLKTLPADKRKELRWDPSNPRIRRFLHVRTAEMVVGVKSDAEKVIRDSVTQAWNEALSPRVAADLIKPSIGLLPQHAQAVRNLANTMFRKGYTEQNVLAYSEDYAQRLLDYRAMMIARTEIRTAQNYGQLAVWQEASNQGLVDSRTAKKVWVVDGNPCPEICLPMEGKAVGLAEAWTLPNGDIVDIPTESHPHCMCGMVLDFGATETESE